MSWDCEFRCLSINCIVMYQLNKRLVFFSPADTRNHLLIKKLWCIDANPTWILSTNKRTGKWAPASLVANGWMSKRLTMTIESNMSCMPVYEWYILCEKRKEEIKKKINWNKQLPSWLKFTTERENNQSIPFLDTKIIRSDDKFQSTWYTKLTDTGVTMNFHYVAPLKYKRSVISRLVHRIYHVCSLWSNIHSCMIKAKKMFEKNQYLPADFILSRIMPVE